MEHDVTMAIAEILSDLGVDPEAVKDDATLGDQLELDSTDAVEVSLELKRRFGIEVKTQVKGDHTVADLRAAVLDALAAQATSAS